MFCIGSGSGRYNVEKRRHAVVTRDNFKSNCTKSNSSSSRRSVGRPRQSDPFGDVHTTLVCFGCTALIEANTGNQLLCSSIMHVACLRCCDFEIFGMAIDIHWNFPEPNERWNTCNERKYKSNPSITQTLPKIQRPLRL